MRPVFISEIRQAGDQWLHDPLVHTTRAVGPSSADSFVAAALRCFRFHDLLANENPVDALDEVFRRYLHFQRSKAPSTATLRGLRSHLLPFLDRLREESISLESLRLIDIDRYLAQKKSDGCKPRSIATRSRALRSFIRYAVDHGWMKADFSSEIRSPRVSRYAALPRGPEWKDVRRMLRTRV